MLNLNLNLIFHSFIQFKKVNYITTLISFELEIDESSCKDFKGIIKEIGKEIEAEVDNSEFLINSQFLTEESKKLESLDFIVIKY